MPITISKLQCVKLNYWFGILHHDAHMVIAALGHHNGPIQIITLHSPLSRELAG